MKYQHVICTVIVLLSVNSVCYSYDDEKVHPEININAAKQSVLGTQDYLQYIGFKQGLNTEFTYGSEKLTIERWIARGGADEDNPLLTFRYARHFHDPLKSWDQVGLDIDGVPRFSSSIEWSQAATTNYYNQWSWNWARPYYYNALTTGDEGYYANTFKALGHLMHLLSDMAVPAHVRNDSQTPFQIEHSHQKFTFYLRSVA